jgi:hypothetical protein
MDNTMLKYLFTAIYDDGTAYKQNAEDVSVSDPNRSCFYDVDHTKLYCFSLSDGKDEYTVLMKDGCFEVNGRKFGAYDKDVTNRRLIFFRRHTHSINNGVELSHDIEYLLGWQGNDPETGENIQRVISFR